MDKRIPAMQERALLGGRVTWTPLKPLQLKKKSASMSRSNW